mgnify:FL=1
MHFYVLGSSMEHRVLRRLHANDVVTVDHDRIDNLHLQIPQQPVKPYDLARSDNRSSIFSISAW